LPAFSYSSFELNVFEFDLNHPVLCTVVYRPPTYNKDFIDDFSDFLASVMIKYDRVLIVGDFNIHLCCPEKPLVKAFLNLVESFNLTQSVVCPTHICGHTLDLVLTYGLPISNINVCDATFSDHLPVLFEICTSCDYKETAPKRLRRIIKPTTSHLFSEAFNSIELDYLMPSQGLMN